jgi:hypothetical protein
MSTINAYLATRFTQLKARLRDERGEGGPLTFVVISAGLLIFALAAVAAFTTTGQKYLDQIINQK